MKNIFRLASAVVLIALASACTRYASYNAVPFVSLNTNKASVEESDPATKFSLPVNLYNYDGDCTVAYTITDITAKNGLDYTPVDASGVLNFTAGTTTKNIEVTVSGQPGVFTGALTFGIELKSVSEGVNLGNYTKCTVTVGDLDHPLTALFGDYDMQGVTNSSSGYVISKWTMEISQYNDNPYRCWISNIIPFCDDGYYGSYLDGPCKVYGEVSEDLSTITIPLPQTLGTTGDAAFGDPNYFKIYAWDGKNNTGTFNTNPSKIVFKKGVDAEGKVCYVTTDPYGMTNDEDIAAFGGAYYYFYMTVFSQFNSTSYPTMFSKQ